MCIDRFVWHKSIFRVIEILCFGLGIIRDSLLVICICICEHIQHRMRFSLMIRARFVEVQYIGNSKGRKENPTVVR